MINEKNILILGSKKGSKLPNIKVDMIYSANGAAERAAMYKKLYPNVPHTAIVGGKYFLECEEVKERVIKSKPNKLIVRFGSIKIPDEFNNYNCEIDQWSQKKDFNFQSQFYKLGWYLRYYKKSLQFLNEIKTVEKRIFMINERDREYWLFNFIVNELFEIDTEYYFMIYKKNKIDKNKDEVLLNLIQIGNVMRYIINSLDNSFMLMKNNVKVIFEKLRVLIYKYRGFE